jgi:hypothetical protein
LGGSSKQPAFRGTPSDCRGLQPPPPRGAGEGNAGSGCARTPPASTAAQTAFPAPQVPSSPVSGSYSSVRALFARVFALFTRVNSPSTRVIAPITCVNGSLTRVTGPFTRVRRPNTRVRTAITAAHAPHPSGPRPQPASKTRRPPPLDRGRGKYDWLHLYGLRSLASDAPSTPMPAPRQALIPPANILTPLYRSEISFLTIPLATAEPGSCP